jgi:hypothetical protein
MDMKIVFALLLSLVFIGGCTQTVADLDAAIQKSAPSLCKGASVAYQTFVAADLGSQKDKDTIAAAWASIDGLCESPSTITSAQLAIVVAQTSVIIRTIRKVKENGNL